MEAHIWAHTSTYTSRDVGVGLEAQGGKARGKVSKPKVWYGIRWSAGRQHHLPSIGKSYISNTNCEPEAVNEAAWHGWMQVRLTSGQAHMYLLASSSTSGAAAIWVHGRPVGLTAS